ncbi:MAG TPA: chromate transporter [Papillibacter sp.]|nr:chromate transporter [Papillibacter sp.]
MRKDIKFYGKLFSGCLRISAFTFGGGYVIVPLIKKRFVDEYGWVSEEQMLDYIAIGQSSPGPIAVNTSAMMGYGLAGLPGALVAVFATVLPPLVTLSIVSVFYSLVIENAVVRNVLRGMQAGVAAVVLDVVIDLIAAVTKSRRAVPIVLMAAAFIAAAVFKVNVALVILTCAVYGALTVVKARRKERDNGHS